MELVDPEYRVGDKERENLVLGIIENVSTPFTVFADPRIRVLVAGCSVKSYKAFEVFREVRRNPVQDDRDAVLVEHVYHELKVGGRTESRSDRIVACYLITP